MNRWLILSLAVLLVACGPGDPTTTPVGCVSLGGQPAHALFADYAGRWITATDRATNAQRFALAPEVQALQGLREDLAAEAVPNCAVAAQQVYLALMDTTIAAYTAVLRQQSPADIDGAFDRVLAGEAALKDALQRLPR